MEGALQMPAEKKRQPRRSSILKRPLADVGEVEKRRVSFRERVMVKEYHEDDKEQLPHCVECIQAESTTEQQKQQQEQQQDVYMIPANQSFYQISTPVDNKKRRLSETVVSRLSIIPPLLEKSFLTDDDLPDFEVFEEDSNEPVMAPKESLCISENSNQPPSSDQPCLDCISPAGNVITNESTVFGGSMTFTCVDGPEKVEPKPIIEEDLVMFGDSMELTLMEDEQSSNLSFHSRDQESNFANLITQQDPPTGQLHPPADQPHPLADQPRLPADQPHPHADQTHPRADQPHPLADQLHPSKDLPSPPAGQPYTHVDKPHPAVNQPHPHANQPHPQSPADKPHPHTDQPHTPTHQPFPSVDQPYPPADQPHPPADQPHPLADQPYPPADQTYPPADQPCPPADQPHPPADQPCPPAEQPYPPADQPCPPADQPYPPAEQPCPPADQPYPPADQPYPPAEQPCPPAEQPCPPGEQPCPPAINATFSIAPPVKPIPGFKRPRQILPTSVVSKRLAFGKTKPALKSPAITQATGQLQRLPFSTFLPMKSPGCITSSVLKKTGKTPNKPAVPASQPPTPGPHQSTSIHDRTHVIGPCSSPSSPALIDLSCLTPTPETHLNAPLSIQTPKIVRLDTTLQNKTISPPAFSDLLHSGDQSRLEPVHTGGVDKSIRVVSPLTLGRFVNFANADKSLNLGVEYALQQQQQQEKEEEEEEEKEAEPSELKFTLSAQELYVSHEQHLQQEGGIEQNQVVKLKEEEDQEYGNNEEQQEEKQREEEEEEEEKQHSHACEGESQVQAEKSAPTTDMPRSESLVLPQQATQASGRRLVEHLEELHERLSMLHRVSVVRVLSKSYVRNHKELRGYLQHFYDIIHACICMLRSLIDYVRLTDVADVPCSLEPVPPSLLPEGDADISGRLIEQARWIKALCDTFCPLYSACHDVMRTILSLCGWYISCWGRSVVEVHFKRKVQLQFELDTGQPEGNPGGVLCQKVKNIVIDHSEGCDVPRGLRCRSVLEIPVVLQMVSRAI